MEAGQFYTNGFLFQGQMRALLAFHCSIYLIRTCRFHMKCSQKWTLEMLIANICCTVFNLITSCVLHRIGQGFLDTFLEPPQHCTFGMSPLSDTAISDVGVNTYELMS